MKLNKRAIGFAAAFVFAATGVAFAAAPEIKGPVHLIFATQGVGTGAYQYASAFATVFQKGLPAGSKIDLNTESPGAVGAPIIADRGKCDIIMSNSGPAKWAAEKPILKGQKEPTKNTAIIAGGLGHDFFNVLFTKDFVDKNNVTTVEEVFAKKLPVRIAIKKPGSLGYLACVKLLECFGLTEKDIAAWGGKVELLGGDAIKTYLQDGKADMTVDHVAAGQANTTELCMTHEMYFPQLSDATLKKLVDAGFDYITIEPNTWKGQTKAVKSVGSQQVIMVRKDMDNAVAYALAKSIVDNRAELAAQQAALKFFDPKEGCKPTQTGIALHPGAAAYYKDAGYMK